MGKMIEQIWIRKTRWTPRAPSSLWRCGPDPAHTIPACGKPHKKALQKRALDHSYVDQNFLALRAATTEGVQFLGVRPSPTTLTTNQNFLSHKAYPIDQ